MLLSEKYLIILIVLTLFKQNVTENQLLKNSAKELNGVEDDVNRFKRNDDSVVESGEGDSIGRPVKDHVPPGHNKQQNRRNQNNGNPNNSRRPGRQINLHNPHVIYGPCMPHYTYRYHFGPNHFPYHNRPKPLHPSFGNEAPHKNFYYGYGPNSILELNVPKPLLKNCEQDVQISIVDGILYANGVRAFLIDANDIRK